MQSKKIVKLIMNKNLNSEFLNSFATLLRKNNLTNLVPSIILELNKLEKREKEMNREEIISSYSISEENIKLLTGKYNLQNPENRVEKEIITGYKIYTRNKIVDASLNTILRNFYKIKN